MARPLSGRPVRSFAVAPLDWRLVLLVCGMVLCILAVGMLPSLLLDLAAGHPDWQTFAASALVTLFVGVTMVLENRQARPGHLSARDAFLLTGMVWILTSLFAALPFAFSGLALSPADALFEAVSGLTTTGATVLSGLDALPPGILLWRAVLQWIGGIGIVVVGVAILPMLNVGGMQLVRTESSDLSEKALPRAGQVTAFIVAIYVGLTLLCLFAYAAVGMNAFDALVHAMTTVATGGFSSHDASIAWFSSPAIEWIAIVFMLAGGLPFVLYLFVIHGRFDRALRDEQVYWYLGIVLAATLALAAHLVANGILHGTEALRHALFTVVSLVTTTGYASTDYGAWGPFAVTLAFLLTAVGGCTGSTAGGIKSFRFAVLYAITRVQLLRLLQPSGVFTASYNGRPIDDLTAISVLAFVFVFGISFSAVALVLALLGLDFLTAMSASVAALANVGPGLGAIVGPTGNFAPLPDAAKYVLAFAMLLGRLELFTILVLLTPAFWRG